MFIMLLALGQAYLRLDLGLLVLERVLVHLPVEVGIQQPALPLLQVLDAPGNSVLHFPYFIPENPMDAGPAHLHNDGSQGGALSGPRVGEDVIPEHFRTDRLIRLIRQHFPTLRWRRHRLVWTGSGCNGGDHAMLLLDDRLIFRFPAPDMVNDFRLELDVLAELRPRVKLYVPHYEYVPPDRSFGGCRPIRGSRLTPARFRRLGTAHRERMAKDLAAFLNGVHGLPLLRARQLGVRTLNTKQTDPYVGQLWRDFHRTRDLLAPEARRVARDTIEVR